MPLDEEGMWLNIWPQLGCEIKYKLKPIHVHIPFQSFILLRSDVVHGGHFGSAGNSRFGIVYKVNNER